MELWICSREVLFEARQADIATEKGEMRLSYHLSGTGGWRCGSSTGIAEFGNKLLLPYSDWERLYYHADQKMSLMLRFEPKIQSITGIEIKHIAMLAGYLNYRDIEKLQQ